MPVEGVDGANSGVGVAFGLSSGLGGTARGVSAGISARSLGSGMGAGRGNVSGSGWIASGTRSVGLAVSTGCAFNSGAGAGLSSATRVSALTSSFGSGRLPV